MRLRHIREKSGILELPSSVLEIGPGPGYFCETYLAYHPGAQYAALETDHACHGPLRKLGIEVFDCFEGLDKKGMYFELLVMSHVLEHCQCPSEFLEKALHFLKPGGILFIEVPCRDFEYKKVFDAHILFFDKHPMEQLLLRDSLTDLRLSYHGEDIEKLKQENQLFYRLFYRMLNKYRRVLQRFGRKMVQEAEASELPVPDVGMWEAVRSYEAHVESLRASRWLRVLARKT